MRRGRQTAKSQHIRRHCLQLRRGWRRHVRVLARPRPHSARPTHLKRVARIADYAFKAAALRGPQGEGPGSGDACGDGRSSRDVVATARDGASSVRAGRRWRTRFVSESPVRPAESPDGPPWSSGGRPRTKEMGVRGRACPAERGAASVRGSVATADHLQGTKLRPTHPHS